MVFTFKNEKQEVECEKENILVKLVKTTSVPIPQHMRNINFRVEAWNHLYHVLLVFPKYMPLQLNKRKKRRVSVMANVIYFRMNLVVQALLKNWFLCGIVLFILLAWADPTIGMKGGPLHPEITIKYFGKRVCIGYNLL